MLEWSKWLLFAPNTVDMNYPSSLIMIGLFAGLASGCAEPEKLAELDYSGWVPQAAMDTVRADNRRLVNELAFAQFQLDNCQGPDAALKKANYHVDRGEHSQAKPHLEKAKGHGAVHAKKAAEVEKRMSTAATGKVNTTDNMENIVTVKDEADGITWYYDRRVPRGLDTTAFYLYIGHKATGGPWLRMRSQYAGDHWIYIHAIHLDAGALHVDRQLDPALMFSKAGDLTVTEWNDTPPSLTDLRVIREIAGSPDAEITFMGHKEKVTRRLTDQERDAFINVLRLYEAMGKVEELSNM